RPSCDKMMHRNGKKRRFAPHNSGFSQKRQKHLAGHIMAELLLNGYAISSISGIWQGNMIYYENLINLKPVSGNILI
ncbi:hypothetical protein DLV42_24855, partial [Escherichia coli]|nr:hypothetical protein [Escherichia coli]